MSRKKQYRVYEGLRVATFLTFISGYLNAFTFITQGGRFAGVQSGNVICLAYYLALGDLAQVYNFAIPILFFIIGQFFTYLAKHYFLKSPYSWHFGSSIIMTFLVTLSVILTPIVPDGFTIAILAFVSSIQVETFRKLRGASYANVMMTGNVKNAAYLWFMGMVEKDLELQKRGINIFLVILSFMLGVIISTQLSLFLGEYALFFILIPLICVNIQLWYEKNPRIF